MQEKEFVGQAKPPDPPITMEGDPVRPDAQGRFRWSKRPKPVDFCCMYIFPCLWCMENSSSFETCVLEFDDNSRTIAHTGYHVRLGVPTLVSTALRPGDDSLFPIGSPLLPGMLVGTREATTGVLSAGRSREDLSDDVLLGGQLGRPPNRALLDPSTLPRRWNKLQSRSKPT